MSTQRQAGLGLIAALKLRRSAPVEAKAALNRFQSALSIDDYTAFKNVWHAWVVEKNVPLRAENAVVTFIDKVSQK